MVADIRERKRKETAKTARRALMMNKSILKDQELTKRFPLKSFDALQLFNNELMIQVPNEPPEETELFKKCVSLFSLL